MLITGRGNYCDNAGCDDEDGEASGVASGSCSQGGSAGGNADGDDDIMAQSPGDIHANTQRVLRGALSYENCCVVILSAMQNLQSNVTVHCRIDDFTAQFILPVMQNYQRQYKSLSAVY